LEASERDSAWLPRSDLQRLIDALAAAGHRVLGPVARDGAIVWDELRRAAELPEGWREQQAPGSYRLEKVGHARVFDVVNGPSSLKAFVFAPREELLQITQEGRGFRAESLRPEPPKLALLGVRACDLAALRVQDRIFLHDRVPDPAYAIRRERLFLVAVNCTRSAQTCFCVSMGTGPEAESGFDLALTEFDDGFVLRAGSPAGSEIAAALAPAAAPAARKDEERAALSACAAHMTRALDTSDLPEMLYRNLEHPHWDEVAKRCLSCANCTQVCPTCFCHDERDEPFLDGSGSIRVREWDSCFNREHAQVHGLNFRPKVAHRYRQWLVHKLAGWIDQFGTSGCVGCGRCIAWCPTGIDLTEEVEALREPRV
jgi:ferredoxin